MLSCHAIPTDCNNNGDWSVCRLHTDERYDIFSIYVMRKPRKFKGCGFEY